LALGLKNKENN